MTATYTFDVFSTLDGYASFGPGANWGGSTVRRASSAFIGS